MNLPFTPIPPEQVREHKIYVIVNTVNGKMYVGRTRGLVGSRWRGHFWGTKSKPLVRIGSLGEAICVHGAHAFAVHVVEDCLTLPEACQRESEWIKKLGTASRSRGYNIHLGPATSEQFNPIDQFVGTPHGRRMTGVRAVNEIDDGGNTIRKYTSTVEAAKAIGAKSHSVAMACNGRNKTLHGHRFRWATDESRPHSARRWSRPIIQCDSDGHEIKRFECVAHASKALRVRASNLYQCCAEPVMNRSSAGYRWMYGDVAGSTSLVRAVPDAAGNFKRVQIIQRIEQVTGSGEIVAVHDNMASAAASVGLKTAASILQACRDARKTAAGFHWRKVENLNAGT